MYFISKAGNVFPDTSYLSQDQFRINSISTATMTRADKFKTTTNIVPGMAQ